MAGQFQHERYPFQRLADLMGMSAAVAYRSFRLGGGDYATTMERGLTARVADRLAVKAGFHPFEVWPELADAQIEACSVPCEKCQVRFVPTRKGHRFCSRRCGRNAWRQGKPRVVSEREREGQRAYWASMPETVRRVYNEQRRERWATDGEYRAARIAANTRWQERNREKHAAHSRAYRARKREMT